MNISKIIVGELECNCYLLEKDNNCLLIDPGAEYNKIKEFIKEKDIIGILITHHHFDHIGCLTNLVNDYKNLKVGTNNINNFNFEVIKTYGHTMDSITYYFKEEKVMFTGDFLFYDTIGRYDFPESNVEEMKLSIEKIKKYPSDITIYPGHGIETTLEREKNHNIYFEINL